jgi:anti-sigma B factor antagonist
VTDDELDLEVIRDGDVTVIVVQGEVDFTTAPQLDAAMSDASDGAKALVVDLTRVGFIDSSGLRVLVTHGTDEGGPPIAVACERLHRRLFEITQLHEAMPVCESVEEAAAALRDARK